MNDKPAHHESSRSTLRAPKVVPVIEFD